MRFWQSIHSQFTKLQVPHSTNYENFHLSWHCCHCYFNVNILADLNSHFHRFLLFQGVDHIFISQCLPPQIAVDPPLHPNPLPILRSPFTCTTTILTRPTRNTGLTTIIHAGTVSKVLKVDCVDCSLLIRPVPLRPSRLSMPTASVVDPLTVRSQNPFSYI